MVLGSPADHPHIRGEHSSTKAALSMLIGSSPHTWGTLILSYKGEKLERIIPTYVGNTSGPGASSSPWPDHPHIRGEHSPASTDQGLWIGSSPHTWGTRKAPFHRQTRVADHPHIRGEHAFHPSPASDRPGSSPHTWGTRRIGVHKRGVDRIIPTYVGNTCWRSMPRQNGSDHPHIRGEHGNISSQESSKGGSSPHTWGTLAGSEAAA